MYRDRNSTYGRYNELNNLSSANSELIWRGLAAYYGMTVIELNAVINGDPKKLKRFYDDYIYNHN